jgi:Kef-type K+ transport system membrane component KefB
MDTSVIAQFLPLLTGLLVAWLLARWLNRRGIDVTGLEAVVLGVLAGPHGQALITPSLLHDLSPALSFALGALGFLMGLQFRITTIQSRPKASLRIALVVAVVTALIVGSVCYGLVLLLFGDAHLNVIVGILTAAALLSAPSAVDQVVERKGASGAVTDLSRQAAVFSQVIGVFVFGIVLCVFHTDSGSFGDARPLVAVEWIVLAIGVGLVDGLLFAWFLGSRSDSEDTLTVTVVGMLLFASGVAFALKLSPLLICLVAGIAVANTSPAWAELQAGLKALERPMFTVILFVAAAAWTIPPVSVWVLVLGFIIARVLARHWGGAIAKMAVSEDETRPVERIGLSLIAQGGMVVAIAVNAWQVYPNAIAQTVLTCLLAAGLANELPGIWVVRNILEGVGEIPIEAPARSKAEV